MSSLYHLSKKKKCLKFFYCIGAGTSLKFRPGMLIGGDEFTHDCPTSRSIGFVDAVGGYINCVSRRMRHDVVGIQMQTRYFVEALIPLALFCKNPLEIMFTGVTNDNRDCSVSLLKSSWCLRFCHRVLCRPYLVSSSCNVPD